jgi:hypothetical protein
MPSKITIIAAAIVCLVSVSASAGDISAAAKPDCAQATSDYERSEFGCPIDLERGSTDRKLCWVAGG